MMGARKLGRLPRAHGAVARYEAIRGTLPMLSLPPAKNWLDGMPSTLGSMLNDQLGCCAIAALHHARQVWSFNAGGAMMTDLDQAVLQDYENLCGYNPTDPISDRGAVLQDVLPLTVSRGITTDHGPDRLLGFAEIAPRAMAHIREAIALAGVAYIGIEIPQLWSGAEAGAVWDATNSAIAGGHCVILAGYDPDGFDVISWGLRFRLTNAGFMQCCSEAYALFDKNWIQQSGLTPQGIDMQVLEQTLRAVAIAQG